MAQTNAVSVFVQMTTVTASGVTDQPEDCSPIVNRTIALCQIVFNEDLSICLSVAYRSKNPSRVGKKCADEPGMSR